MNKPNEHLENLKAMRSIMERSTKFNALSGRAGIFVGLYSAVAAYIAFFHWGFKPTSPAYSVPVVSELGSSFSPFILLAITLFGISALTAVYFSYKQSIKQNEPVWNDLTRRLIRAISIPLITGAIVIGLLHGYELHGLILGCMLIFYGLSLLQAAHFTHKEVEWLGKGQLILGLAAFARIDYSLAFWILGFCVLHIIYGIYMYRLFEQSTPSR